MGVSYVKFCPRCQTTTAMDSALCPNCGHQFRTHFQAPVSEKTVAMTSVPEAEKVQPGPSPLREVVPEHRPRPRLVLLAATALAILGLTYGIFTKRSQPAPPLLPKTAFRPYDVVIKADAQGDSAPVATQSPEDLQQWKATQPPPSASNDAAVGDDPARVHLYFSKRIVLIPQGSLGRVLLEQGAWRRIQIIDGLYRGTTGFISGNAVVRLGDLAPKSAETETATR